MKKWMLKKLLKWVRNEYAMSDKKNSHQIVDCATYLLEEL